MTFLERGGGELFNAYLEEICTKNPKTMTFGFNIILFIIIIVLIIILINMIITSIVTLIIIIIISCECGIELPGSISNGVR